MTQMICDAIFRNARTIQATWAKETLGTEHMPDFEAVHIAYSNWCDLPYTGSLSQAGNVWRELKARIKRYGRYPLIATNCIWSLATAKQAYPDRRRSIDNYEDRILSCLKDRRPLAARRVISMVAMDLPDIAVLETVSAMLDETLRAEEAGMVDNYWRNSNGREGAGRFWKGLVQVNESHWRDRAQEVLYSAYERAVKAGLRCICGDLAAPNEGEIRRLMDVESPDSVTFLLAAGHESSIRPDTDLEKVRRLVSDIMKESRRPAQALIESFLAAEYRATITSEVLTESVAIRGAAEREFGKEFVEYALNGEMSMRQGQPSPRVAKPTSQGMVL